MKTFKYFFLGFFVVTLVLGGAELYHDYVLYKWVTIEKERFYRSRVMPTERLLNVIEKKKIKTVVDLRHGEIGDELHPENTSQILEEKKSLLSNEKVNYLRIPSSQIPTQENLAVFFRIIDNEENYPILVHCHDGVGRAVIYSAIYRIEKVGWTKEEAREKARLFPQFNNFSLNSKKGKFLSNYVPRKGKQKKEVIAVAPDKHSPIFHDEFSD